ncbi:MAG: hypothetical protein R3Y21_05120 [Mycoplasmatota bacterium]
MIEFIGFVTGFCLFLAMLLYFFHNIIYSTGFLIFLLCLIFVIILLYLSYKKTERKHFNMIQDELQQTLIDYIQKKRHLKLSNYELVIIESYTEDINLIAGENLLFKKGNDLCFFPNVPTMDNYLLYGNVEVIKIKNIKELLYTGNIEKNSYFDNLNNININQYDDRRTKIIYGDEEIVLDYYALEKIRKLFKGNI